MRNRNVSNGNANKPPRAKKSHTVKDNDEAVNVRNNSGPDGVFHAEQQGANEMVSRAEQSKFGDWKPGRNSAIIQQRDVDGDSTGGRKGKK